MNRHDGDYGLIYDFHETVAADADNAVYIGTLNAYHFEYVETAAELGKAVLYEKHLEASVERAERLVEAAENADIPLMKAYRSTPNLRFDDRKSSLSTGWWKI